MTEVDGHEVVCSGSLVLQQGATATIAPFDGEDYRLRFRFELSDSESNFDIIPDDNRIFLECLIRTNVKKYGKEMGTKEKILIAEDEQNKKSYLSLIVNFVGTFEQYTLALFYTIVREL
ncbi:hypothetical protein [Bosea sp. FBZP-16]|uniref:hypothetical protein n=1 Tax=Bosea sp. FBZP-16 TaxID=2065382 RepID=UPI001319D996|nr:hypothetical protein [Bosea sp. FBZP-16]